MIVPASDEASLIARWQDGERDAGCELLQRYTPALTAYFRSRTHANIDELVQRTLVACFEAVARFEGRSSFKTFLLGIARNQFFTSLRDRRQLGDATASATCATLPEDSPSQLVASKQELRVLATAFTSIASPFRDVLQMFYWEGLSVVTIAVNLQIPTGTVKSRLSRGRATLKARLDGGAEPYGDVVLKLIR
jgi:RNA polymerase sigma factor (sigma-70 family)